MQDSGVPTVDFEGRVAIVTGAANGLGRDYAKELAARGAAVLVNDLCTDPHGRLLIEQAAETPAEEVVREIREAGGTAVACHHSCATREGGTAIVAAAIEAFGRLDILVHNAGFLRNAPFEDMTDEQICAIFDVHLMAGFYLGQPAFRLMKAQNYGRIVLISSCSGMFGSMWQANYSAAKGGLFGLMNNIAQEGRRSGIQVNTVLPNAFSRLGRGKDEWPAEFFEDLPEDMDLIIPALRNEFVVPMVVWLASERCRATQSVYTATAGRFARVFVGEGQGWLADYATPPSPEDIERHLAQIDDTSGFFTPKNVFDEYSSIIEARRAVAAI